MLADTTGGSGMSAAQQQLFFKEASDASYRAKGNLTPDQQVRGWKPNVLFVVSMRWNDLRTTPPVHFVCTCGE